MGDGLAYQRASRLQGSLCGNTRSLGLEGQCQGPAYIRNRKDRRNSIRLTLGMSFAAKFVVYLKLPSLSLFLEKATHSFQPRAFRGRMVCAE